MASEAASASDAGDRSTRARRLALQGGLVAVAAIGAAFLILRVEDRPAQASLEPTFAPRRDASFHAKNPRDVLAQVAFAERPSFTRDGRAIVFSHRERGRFRVALGDLESGEVRDITHGPGSERAPALSPDGTRVAFVREDARDATTFVAPLDGSSPPRAIARGSVAPAFSPDGRAIWAGDEDHVARYDATTLEPLRKLEKGGSAGFESLVELDDGTVVARTRFDELARISPQGDWVVVVRASELYPFIARDTRSEAVLFGMPGGVGRVALRGAGDALEELDVDPRAGFHIRADRRAIVWSTSEPAHRVARLVARAGELAVEWSEPRGPELATHGVSVASRARRWSPQAREAEMLLYTKLPASEPSLGGIGLPFVIDDRGRVLRALGSRDEKVLALDGEPGGATSLSRDETTIFYAARSGASSCVEAVPATGAKPRVVAAAPSRAPAASPARDVIVYLAGDAATGARLVRLDLATNERVDLGAAPDGAHALAFSRDGAELAVASEDAIAIVDAETGAVRAHFDSRGAIVQAILFGDDGLYAAGVVSRGGVRIADLDAE